MSWGLTPGLTPGLVRRGQDVCHEAVTRRRPAGAVRPGRYHPRMAERSAVERELAEIGTQLAWVRDYL
jgi:hypothetical protein